MGSGGFGEPALRMLVYEGHRILCVVTQPDKKQNRGMRLESTAIKKAALELGLSVYQPDDINSAESVAYLQKLKPDIFVVIAYGQKLSSAVLRIPAIMPLNIHASLLPAYRGAAPINSAIIHGEKETGVTLMKVSLRMDTGPVLLQKSVTILDTDTAETLSEKLSVIAGPVLIEGIKRLASENCPLIPQDESKASVAAKLKKSDGLIVWSRPAADILNLIRGCMPWPGAFTYYKQKMVKIHKASAVSLPGIDAMTPGQIARVSKEGIVVATADGAVSIETLQMEGKRIISAGDFIAGYKVKVQDTFG